MSANTPVTDSRYAIRFTGNPSTAVAKHKSLTGEGPLTLAPEHVLSILLPDALSRNADGSVNITQRDLNALFVPGLLFDREVAELGCHLALSVDKMALALQLIDHAGLDMKPEHGPAQEAWPVISARIIAAILKLPVHDRLIVAADTSYDPPSGEDAETRSWFDWMSPHLLSQQGCTQMEMGQFLSVWTHVYVKHDRDHEEEFSLLADLVLRCTGRDLDGLDQRAQATAVAAWWKNTSPPPELAPYVADPSTGC